MQLIAVYTTVATQEEARRIAKALVERKLAACAQITAIESFYAWNGAVQHEPEWRVLFKTTAAQYATVETAVRDLHTYELPAIHAVAIEHIFAPYAAWIEEGSSGE
ncbi:divalent-cation tolerance protein CutA [Phormidium sp. FACHB-592]|uniref:Divalent-cation tolerance protein CutA n=1 Tax=Stenomitos frigidus AS-A4 TaxID=2933935 RepID=A0ABV0KQE2_9CYAN|nr:divalent-cation tolerance protein CutA [Phormidium sp. FACHB-592]MBD2074976.1 divalent-cation tolerance protein CutA [Phormidium sp. FACHB-592]